jgi:NADPH-dependent 2,4-dienoyl-CoA reductase/sulfur reductase-like enzyme
LNGKNITFLSNRFLHSINEENKEIIFTSSEGIEKISCKALVYTAGARERPFGSLLIPGNRVSGIYTAGMAQRLTNIENRLPGKKALILGSGDIGLIMARRLTLEGMKVEAVLERMPYPGGLARNITQCLKDFEIPLLLSTTVVEVRGQGRLNEVIVAQVDGNFNEIKSTRRSYSVDSLILSVGLVPSTTPVMHLVEIDKRTRGVVVDSIMRTNKEWVFAAGNCVVIYDLVDYVSKEGEIAGENAAKYILGETFGKKIKINPGNNIGIISPSFYVENTELELYVRVIRPCENKKIIVKSGQDIIHQSRHISMIPSEMEHIKIKKDKLLNVKELTVEVIENE